MSFDGILLNRIANDLSFLKTGRISKITESGDTDFLLTVRHERINHNIMLSFSSEYSRIHLTKRLYDQVQNPKSFTLFLRKHIEGYFIEDLYTYKNDRILIFKLKGYNELCDLNTKYLICEIMGRYSNMILTDSDYIIIDALKHDGVGEYNRTILPYAKYEFPLNLKLDPYNTDNDLLDKEFNEIKTPKDVVLKFNGLSLTTSTYLFKNDLIKENFKELINIENRPCIIINEKGKRDFSFNPLNYEVVKEFDSYQELLDTYFYDLDLKMKVKAKTHDLEAFINRELKKYIKKLEKLNSELLDSSSKEELKLYGELLLSSTSLKEKKNVERVYNYYTNEYIDIKLDNKYTVLENSNRYYKKYQKMKSSIQYINEQIEITKNEIDYFTILKYQIKDASINEALDIQDELIQNKYLFNVKEQNKKKNQKPKLLEYLVGDTIISVGKNNIQNEYLTHKKSKPNDLWFHVKDNPGSHVVIHKDLDYTEEEIRVAANLAAYYSESKDSSSVQVDYTKIKYIKKIPGRRLCFVTYTHQQSIYIDPNFDDIMKLKVKK